jgi:mannose/fructose/N-acetylgalactosamine-specific phosphotransferase system component IIC
VSLLGSWEWISLAVLGALLALDAGPWVVSMAARPLPAGVLLGLAWGDPAGGAVTGAVLELVYAGVLPVGGSRYPEAGLAGLCGAALAMWAAPIVGAASLPAGVAWGVVAGQVGKQVETWRRARNARLAAAARAAAAAGDASAVGRALRDASLLAAALGAAVAAGLVGWGQLLAAPFVDLAPDVMAARPPAFLVAGLALGAVIRLWSSWSVRAALVAGAAAGLAIGFALGRRGGGAA